jgi:hypothetical protein
LWGPDRDRDADDAAQADRAEQVGFRPLTPGGSGGSRSPGGWGCPPALVGILAAPWLLDLLLTASGRLT